MVILRDCCKLRSAALGFIFNGALRKKAMHAILRKESKIGMLLVLSMLAIGQTSVSFGAEAFWQAAITKIVVKPETGFCAAWMTPGPQNNPQNPLASCDDRWVNFDCTGDFGSKSAGTSAFSIVQLAAVSGKPISILVTDQKVVDVGTTTYCLATQVQYNP